MSDASRPNTRSQGLLKAPGVAGRAAHIRSRTPSPANPGREQRFFPASPTETEGEQFFDATGSNPEDNMATPEQLAALREQIRSEMRAEFRNEAAAAAAQVPDAIKRKPEIPAFDKEHIDAIRQFLENHLDPNPIVNTIH